MQSLHRQRGMTPIGWILVFLLIAFFTLITLKLVPIYLDGYKVSSILSSLESEPETGARSPAEIIRTIEKRLDINMVDAVTADDIYVEKVGDKMTIEIDYEVRKNMLGNIDVVVSFHKTAEVPAR
jgi:hypothetical protein